MQTSRKTARMNDVKEVIQALQNSPTAAYLRECSFHERLMLTSLVKCMKREGVEEIKWGEVRVASNFRINALNNFLLGTTSAPYIHERSFVSADRSFAQTHAK